MTLDFDTWWCTLLQNDRVDLGAHMLDCVFCGREFTDAKRSMLAWWAPGDPHDRFRIKAAGIYCRGRERGCLDRAGFPGQLLDAHVRTGARALLDLDRISFEYREWEPAALRRLNGVCFNLARLPPSSGAPSGSLGDTDDDWKRAETEWNEKAYLERTRGTTP